MKDTLWSDPDLPADHFLYHRKGPWPQPSPSYPMAQAPEILNIPPEESLLWNQAIGSRYFETLNFYPGSPAFFKVSPLGDGAEDGAPDLTSVISGMVSAHRKSAKGMLAGGEGDEAIVRPNVDYEVAISYV